MKTYDVTIVGGGLVDFGRVAEAMGGQLLQAGVDIRTNHHVNAIIRDRSGGTAANVVIETSANSAPRDSRADSSTAPNTPSAPWAVHARSTF